MTTITPVTAYGHTVKLDPMSNAQVAEYIIIALESGTDRGKQIARDEIRKMARICDEHAALMRGDR